MCHLSCLTRPHPTLVIGGFVVLIKSSASDTEALCLACLLGLMFGSRYRALLLHAIDPVSHVGEVPIGEGFRLDE